MARKELEYKSIEERLTVELGAAEIQHITPQTFNPEYNLSTVRSVIPLLDSRLGMIEMISSPIEMIPTSVYGSYDYIPGVGIPEYQVGQTVVKKKLGFVPGRRRLVFSPEDNSTSTIVSYTKKQHEIIRIRRRDTVVLDSHGGQGTSVSYPRWKTIWKK